MNIATLCVNCKKNSSCTMCWKTSDKKCPHFIQKTNADRIRAMSDDELATMLKNYKDCSKNCVISNGKNCYQICEEESALLKWLKQPFKGE